MEWVCWGSQLKGLPFIPHAKLYPGLRDPSYGKSAASWVYTEISQNSQHNSHSSSSHKHRSRWAQAAPGRVWQTRIRVKEQIGPWARDQMSGACVDVYIWEICVEFWPPSIIFWKLDKIWYNGEWLEGLFSLLKNRFVSTLKKWEFKM